MQDISGFKNNNILDKLTEIYKKKSIPGALIF